MDQVEIKLADGYVIRLDRDALDNMEIIDVLAEMESDDDLLAVSKILRILLGDEGRKELYAHLRNDKGVVTATAASTVVMMMINALKDTSKN